MHHLTHREFIQSTKLVTSLLACLPLLKKASARECKHTGQLLWAVWWQAHRMGEYTAELRWHFGASRGIRQERQQMMHTFEVSTLHQSRNEWTWTATWNNSKGHGYWETFAWCARWVSFGTVLRVFMCMSFRTVSLSHLFQFCLGVCFFVWSRYWVSSLLLTSLLKLTLCIELPALSWHSFLGC